MNVTTKKIILLIPLIGLIYGFVATKYMYEINPNVIGTLWVIIQSCTVICMAITGLIIF